MCPLPLKTAGKGESVPAVQAGPSPLPCPATWSRQREHALDNDEGYAMSTHFFGLKDWTFSYSHSVGRNEFAGTGFRNPVDLALGADDVVYVINRSYEYRVDGIHVSVVML